MSLLKVLPCASHRNLPMHRPATTGSVQKRDTVWRRSAVGSAASFSLMLTVPGVLLRRDHIIRSDPTPERSYAVSKAVWALIRILNPVTCWFFGFPRENGPRREQLSMRRRILMAMSFVSGARHAFWGIVLLRKPWPLLHLSLPVAAGNNFVDALHCRCAAERESDGTDSGLGSLAWVGVALFAAGSALETISELQRHRFIEAEAKIDTPVREKKSRFIETEAQIDTPAKKERSRRLCTSGLWRWSAHINYLGYAMWRLGIGLVSAPPHTAAFGVAHFLDFHIRAVPLLRRHLAARYGKDWKDYSERTKILVPGVF